MPMPENVHAQVTGSFGSRPLRVVPDDLDFAGDLPEAQKMEIVSHGLDKAIALLNSQDRKRLEAWLKLGDFPIEPVHVTLKRANFTSEEHGLTVAFEIAREISKTLKKLGPTPEEILNERERAKDFLDKLAQSVGALQNFQITERERTVAGEVGGEVRGVIQENLKDSRPVPPTVKVAGGVKDLAKDIPVPVYRVVAFDHAMQAYAKRNGIEFKNVYFDKSVVMMLLTNQMPSVNPTADPTKVEYGHNERMKEAVRHEAVHVMHVTQGAGHRHASGVRALWRPDHRATPPQGSPGDQ